MALVLCGFPQQPVSYDDETTISSLFPNNSTISACLGEDLKKSIKAGKERKPRKPRKKQEDTPESSDEEYTPEATVSNNRPRYFLHHGFSFAEPN